MQKGVRVGIRSIPVGLKIMLSTEQEQEEISHFRWLTKFRQNRGSFYYILHLTEGLEEMGNLTEVKLAFCQCYKLASNPMDPNTV